MITYMTNTFFIIEDHSLMLHGIISWITENSHWKCIGSAQNEVDSLEKLNELCKSETTTPSVIITDINLGTENNDYLGIELIKKLKAENTNIKCICYSMYKSPGIIKLAMDAGASGYITKSASERELVECMNQVQNGEIYIERNLHLAIETYKEAVSSLTQKEMEIVNLMLNHKTNDEISDIMNIKKRTVESYTSRIYDKIGCSNRSELIEILS